MIGSKHVDIRGPITKSKKKKISQLSIILDEPLPAMSLGKLIGTASSYKATKETSLETILDELESLEDENAMSSFINKYGSSTFESLDELLAAHLSNPYELQVKAASSDKLFEGLESILGE